MRRGWSVDQTATFKQMRRTAKQGRFTLQTDETPRSLTETEFSLPPEWVDSYDHVLDEVKKVTKALALLETVQNERLSSAFADNTKKDAEIKAAYQRITHMIKVIESTACDIEAYEGPQADQRIRQNIAQSVHLKLHEHARQLKQLQHKFIECAADGEATQALQLALLGEDATEQAAARDEGINQMLRNLTELSTIFRELSRLVIHQGTILDRIDYNLETAKEQTAASTVALVKAEKHQGRSRAGLVIAVLVVLIGILVGVHILKHF